ncbi:MAG: hypothetical protein AB9869_20455 [Verrucomicrobiia bacterium]
MFRLGALLAAYILVERLLVRVTSLSEAAYGSPYLIVELIRSLFALEPMSLLALALLGAGLFGGIRTRSLGPTWAAFDDGAALRAFITVVACVLAWAYGTYDYNLYFDQGHHGERLLLFAFAGLLVWRPVFVFPFILVLLVVLWQFDLPIGGYSQAEQMLLARVLILFGVFHIAFWLRGKWPVGDFVFLVCCLMAGHYWVCGLGKLQLGWPLNDRVEYLLPATYANGWLGFLEPEAIGRLAAALATGSGPMKAFTLAVECGALLCLWRLKLVRVILVAWIVFHAGVFLVSGICFWKWMLLNAALLFLFCRRDFARIPIFTRGHFLLSIILIGTARLWAAPGNLSWLDSRVAYTYRFEAVSPDGRTWTLPPRFFSPYDYQFTLGDFGYLAGQPHLGIVWGAIMDPSLARALETVTAPEQVRALEAKRGRVALDPGRAAVFDHFIRRIAGNWNRRGLKGGWWRPVRAPRQLWTFARQPEIHEGQRIHQVVVYQVTSLFVGSRYREFRKTRVREIDVDQAVKAGAGRPASCAEGHWRGRLNRAVAGVAIRFSRNGEKAEMTYALAFALAQSVKSEHKVVYQARSWDKKAWLDERPFRFAASVRVPEGSIITSSIWIMRGGRPFRHIPLTTASAAVTAWSIKCA